MIRRPPRSTPSNSSAASDVYKRQLIKVAPVNDGKEYIVLDGLKPGDEIVSDGAGMIREGIQVK